MKELLNRIKTTVEFLKDGEVFEVGGILLGMESSKDMFVSASSKYESRKDLTKTLAIRELKEIKDYFLKW